MTIDRRTTLKWVLTAAAAVPLLDLRANAAEEITEYKPTAQGYGTDPNLTRLYKPGELWPLTLTKAQRETAANLSDVIIPADTQSPSASAVGVVDFLDEWISAPYPRQQRDRNTVLAFLAWIDTEATSRFKVPFAKLNDAQRRAICDDICFLPKAKPVFIEAAKQFARYRDLTASGFYSTPAGRKDLKFMGNTPMARYDGPPLEALKKAGLA